MTETYWSDEKELVERAKGGDFEASKMLVDTYAPMVYKYFRGMGLATDVVEDLVSETFASAFDSLPKFRGDSSFKTWIFGIAHNMRCRHFGEKKRSLLTLSKTFVEKFKGFYTRNAPSNPEAEMILEEQKHLLHQAMQSLPVEFREVLVLRFLEELSMDETAEILQLATGTVNSRTYRAKAMLKEKLERLQKTKQPKRNNYATHAENAQEFPATSEPTQQHIHPMSEQALAYNRSYRNEDRVS